MKNLVVRRNYGKNSPYKTMALLMEFMVVLKIIEPEYQFDHVANGETVINYVKRYANEKPTEIGTCDYKLHVRS